MVRRRNPYSGGKCTALEHERASKRLADKGIGNTVSSVGRNSRRLLSFFKKPLSEIARDPKSLDWWPRSVSFAAYETNRRDIASNTLSNIIEESSQHEDDYTKFAML